MSLLSLSDIELAFGHVALLDDVSLHVERGERIGLIGRYGTGKSSLLSLIAGLRDPDDGSITRAFTLEDQVVGTRPLRATSAASNSPPLWQTRTSPRADPGTTG